MWQTKSAVIQGKMWRVLDRDKLYKSQPWNKNPKSETSSSPKVGTVLSLCAVEVLIPKFPTFIISFPNPKNPYGNTPQTCYDIWPFQQSIRTCGTWSISAKNLMRNRGPSDVTDPTEYGVGESWRVGPSSQLTLGRSSLCRECIVGVSWHYWRSWLSLDRWHGGARLNHGYWHGFRSSSTVIISLYGIAG